MKIAISLPDETYEQASKRARELGMSRSEFFARAAQRYLEELDGSSLTAQVDQALAVAGEDGSTTAAVASGRSRLQVESGW